MLLIPGLASSGAVWDDTVKQLCGAHRCHVFTLAGFAGVPAQPGPLLDDVDAALAAYIEQQHLKAPIVVGHSLGGFVALKLAIDHPADVGKLVIVDALPALGAVRMDSAHAAAAARLRAADARAADGAGSGRLRRRTGAADRDAGRPPPPTWRACRPGAGDSDRVAVIAAMSDMIGPTCARAWPPSRRPRW